MFRRLIDHLRLGDYERAKQTATQEILGRYARGNVLVQQGSVMDDAEFDALCQEGDAAMEAIRRSLPSSMR